MLEKLSESLKITYDLRGPTPRALAITCLSEDVAVAIVSQATYMGIYGGQLYFGSWVDLEPSITLTNAALIHFSADVATNKFTPAGSSWFDGMEVGVIGDILNLPLGIAANTNYFVVGSNGTSFQLSQTQGGTPITLGSSGFGQMTHWAYPTGADLATINSSYALCSYISTGIAYVGMQYSNAVKVCRLSQNAVPSDLVQITTITADVIPENPDNTACCVLKDIPMPNQSSTIADPIYGIVAFSKNTEIRLTLFNVLEGLTLIKTVTTGLYGTKLTMSAINSTQAVLRYSSGTTENIVKITLTDEEEFTIGNPAPLSIGAIDNGQIVALSRYGLVCPHSSDALRASAISVTPTVMAVGSQISLSDLGGDAGSAFVSITKSAHNFWNGSQRYAATAAVSGGSIRKLETLALGAVQFRPLFQRMSATSNAPDALTRIVLGATVLNPTEAFAMEVANKTFDFAGGAMGWSAISGSWQDAPDKYAKFGDGYFKNDTINNVLEIVYSSPIRFRTMTIIYAKDYAGISYYSHLKVYTTADDVKNHVGEIDWIERSTEDLPPASNSSELKSSTRTYDFASYGLEDGGYVKVRLYGAENHRIYKIICGDFGLKAACTPGALLVDVIDTNVETYLPELWRGESAKLSLLATLPLSGVNYGAMISYENMVTLGNRESAPAVIQVNNAGVITDISGDHPVPESGVMRLALPSVVD